MENKKNYYALAFICEDRPGIVMEVSQILLNNDFNIEDSSSTLLEGIFSMILIVSHDMTLSPLQIKKFFAPLVKKLKISLSVRKINGIKRDVIDSSKSTYIISIYGSDKPGIVYNITKVLAQKNINIIDLQTKVSSDQSAPVYLMILEVVVPPSLDEKWKDELYNIAENLNINVNINTIDSYEI